jgi:hypothetical protein
VPAGLPLLPLSPPLAIEFGKLGVLFVVGCAYAGLGYVAAIGWPEWRADFGLPASWELGVTLGIVIVQMVTAYLVFGRDEIAQWTLAGAALTLLVPFRDVRDGLSGSALVASILTACAMCGGYPGRWTIGRLYGFGVGESLRSGACCLDSVGVWWRARSRGETMACARLPVVWTLSRRVWWRERSGGAVVCPHGWPPWARL